MNKIEDYKLMEFEGFGVRIAVISNNSKILKKIKKIIPLVIPENLKFIENNNPEHIFKIEYSKTKKEIKLKKNKEKAIKFMGERSLIEQLSSQIRITVAEFAESKVFIHAGAVGWNGSGIIIPGTSFSGKTTLVSELIRAGAEYYSDEYAVLDEEGFLHPYPKMLSMRGIIDDFTQLDTAPEDFGAKIGKIILPVRLILVTKFEKDAEWNPEVLTTGEGMMEVLQHTIPIRSKPDFVLNVLKKTASRAIIVRSKRGDASSFTSTILKYLESFVNK